MTETQEKPDCRTTAMLSLFSKDKNESKNMIIPLANLTIVDDKTCKFIYNVERELLNIKSIDYDYFSFAISDDPYTQWADDFAHLGCFKMAIIMTNCKVTSDKFLTIECENGKMIQHMVIPDRRIDRL
jgi:hypothetical protein